MELHNLTYDEVSNLLEECKKELERRQREKREQLWNDVVLSIKEFQQQEGDIEIYDSNFGDESYIDGRADFSEFGRIIIN